jgi:polar amino acid transport system substrate-binding protein
MKKIINLIFGSFLIFVSTFVSSTSADELKIGWEPWAPYQFENAQKKLTGLDIELARAIAKQAGMKATFLKRPWKRQLNELQAGSLDALLGASKTPERQAYAYFSDPYRNESVNFYVTKGKLESMKGKLNSLKDLINSNYKIGVVRGYYYGEEYAQLIKNPAFKKHVKEVVDDTTNFRKLLSNRVDGVLVDPVAATADFKKEGWVGKIVPLFEVYSDNIYMMMSKKSTTPAEVKKVNDSLATIKKNGEYQKIIDAYIQK